MLNSLGEVEKEKKFKWFSLCEVISREEVKGKKSIKVANMKKFNWGRSNNSNVSSEVFHVK